MLRHRKLRSQIYQFQDAGIFVAALWLAHGAIWQLDLFAGKQIEAFSFFAWLYVVIIPAVPLVLDFHGFYSRPMLQPRARTAWILFKGCVTVTMGVILVMFLLKISLSRAVIILFGGFSFVLLLVKEELLRAYYRSRFGQQPHRRLRRRRAARRRSGCRRPWPPRRCRPAAPG